jgi:hypothetical protein
VIEGLTLFAVLFLLIFAVPIRIGATGQTSDTQPELLGYVHILFGLIGVTVEYVGELTWSLKLGPLAVLKRRLGEGDDDEKEEEAPEAKKEPEKEPDEKPELSLRERLAEFMAYYDLAKRPAIRFLRRLLKTIWLRRVEVEGTLGAGSPDATGKMAGSIFAAQSVLGPKVRLDVRPDFVTPGFKGQFRLEICFWLGFLIVSLLVAALAIGARFAIWYLRKKLAGFRRPRPQTA